MWRLVVGILVKQMIMEFGYLKNMMELMALTDFI